MLQQVLDRAMELAGDQIGRDTPVSVRVLTPREAVGDAEWDFPLLKGREKLIEADLRGARGQAFSPFARPFHGTVGELISLDVKDPFSRSLKVAFVNALVRMLGLTDRTVHCRDGAPTKCAGHFKERLRERLPWGTLVLVGLQPAILSAAAEALGPSRVMVLDLQDENIGRVVSGVEVLDGALFKEVLEGASMALVTGSSFANGTFDDIAKACEGRCPLILYGTTGAALEALMGFERWCFKGE